MRANLKGANGVVRLLLAHGEKVAMVGVLACVVLLIMAGMNQERLDENLAPQRIDELAQRADANITQMSWNNFPPEEKTEADQVSVSPQEASAAPVRRDAFPELKTAFDPRPTNPIQLRQDPDLLPVVDLEVHAGSGLWASADPERLRQIRLEAVKQQEQERLEEERRQAQLEEEDDFGRGRGRGRGRGGEDRFGEGGGFGGRGGRGGFGSDITPGGALIVRPTGGATTEGYEDIRERSWVTVLGVVPIGAQYQQYLDALENTRDFQPRRDLPTYFGYVVQRAEVTSEGQSQWQTIAQVTERVIVEEIQKWPEQTPELVAPRFVHPWLTFPLPPMVLREWDKSITHSTIPFAEDDMMNQFSRFGRRDARDEQEAEPDEEAGDLNPFERQAQVRAQQEAERYNAGGLDGRGRFDDGRGYTGRGDMDGGRLSRGREFSGRGDMDGGRGYGGRGRGGRMGLGRMGERGEITLPEFTWDGQTEKLLFRYFDTTVTPGHRYVYRVQVALVDVNSKVSEKYLDPTVSERLKESNPGYLFTGWSEPSRPVGVPLPGLIYLAGAEPASERNLTAEAEAEVLIKTLSNEYSAEIARADNFLRGAVINMMGERPDTNTVLWTSSYEPEEGASPTFNLVTGMTLLDFRGGQDLNGSSSHPAPARALVMTPAGSLFLQNELDDQETVKEYRAYTEMAADEWKAQREREEGGGDRDGGRGGRGGFGGRGGRFGD